MKAKKSHSIFSILPINTKDKNKKAKVIPMQNLTRNINDVDLSNSYTNNILLGETNKTMNSVDENVGNL